MSDKVVSLIRTVVPVVWGSFIAWLLTLLPLHPDVVGVLRSFDEAIAVLVIGVFYAGVRWLEPRLPVWLATVLLGSAKVPVYAASEAVYIEPYGSGKPE